MHDIPPSEKPIEYPPELYKDGYDMTYSSAKLYQSQVVKKLKEIFGDEMVKSEWDSVMYDIHTSNHKLVYAPRVDIAIGPFNSFADLDIGIDRTAAMKNHPLVKKLEERTEISWNDLSRCFLSIELVFSGHTKYIAGDFLNATATGAIGFIVAHKKVYEKVRKMHNYFHRLEDFERFGKAGLRNLFVFDDETFLEFLWELKNPDLVKKLSIEKKYNLHFNKLLFSQNFFVHAHTLRHKPMLTNEEVLRLAVYGFDIAAVLEQHDVVLMTTPYTHPSTANIYEVITRDDTRFRIMDIIDIAVRAKYRGKGIGTQMLKIFEGIAHDNNCSVICAEMGYDEPNEPIEAQKNFFDSNGYSVWSDQRAQFSQWVAKKSLT